MNVRLPSVIDLAFAESVMIDTAAASEPFTVEFTDGVEVDIHPAALCALAARANRADSAGGAVRIAPGTVVPEALRPTGIGNHLGVLDGSFSYFPDTTGRLIPVQRVEDNRQARLLVSDFVPMLHADPKTAQAVSYVLWELLRNVIEHAGPAGGAYVAADLKDGRVRLGVADSGIGVPTSIRRSHSAATDRDALTLAFQPGVSGTTRNFGGDENNGGAGLFFMRSMCALAGEALVMASGSSFMRLEARSAVPIDLADALESADVTWVDLPSPLRGTVVGVDLVLDQSGEFDALFAQIRTVYHARVRGRRQEARRARFT